MSEVLDRAAILRSVIEYRLPIEPAIAQLRQLSWDSDRAYAIITRQDIANTLQRFLRQELTASEVHYWGDLLECREDVDYPSADAELLSEAMVQLANPELWGTLSDATAREMHAQILGS